MEWNGKTFHILVSKMDFKKNNAVTRDDPQGQFLAQHSIAMLEQCCNHLKQCRNNVVMLCCTKNRQWESFRVTSPKCRLAARLQYLLINSTLGRKDDGDWCSRNFVYILRTTTTRHMVSFIDFCFHFLVNFRPKLRTIRSLHLLMLWNPYVTQIVSLGYLWSNPKKHARRRWFFTKNPKEKADFIC